MAGQENVDGKRMRVMWSMQSFTLIFFSFTGRLCGLYYWLGEQDFFSFTPTPHNTVILT